VGRHGHRAGECHGRGDESGTDDGDDERTGGEGGFLNGVHDDFSSVLAPRTPGGAESYSRIAITGPHLKDPALVRTGRDRDELAL
jgi:hypothetical protein